MTNMKEIPELDSKGLRQFAFTFAVIICILFGFIVPYIFNHSFSIWPWVVGSVFVVWGILLPVTLRPVYKLWMIFGLLMSKITTPIILGILFYLVLTPVGIVMRCFKADPMARSIDKESNTYKKLRAESENTNFEKPY